MPNPAGDLHFSFSSRVVRLEDGMRMHAVPIPDDMAALWKQAKVRRVIGTLNGHTVNRGLQHHADGGGFLIIGLDLLKTYGLRLGDSVSASLSPDLTPDVFELPEELTVALEQDQPALIRWQTFTPGRQRSLAHYVSSAKREDTRIKRALDLCEKLRTHTLYGDLNP